MLFFSVSVSLFATRTSFFGNSWTPFWFQLAGAFIKFTSRRPLPSAKGEGRGSGDGGNGGGGDDGNEGAAQQQAEEGAAATAAKSGTIHLPSCELRHRSGKMMRDFSTPTTAAAAEDDGGLGSGLGSGLGLGSGSADGSSASATGGGGGGGGGSGGGGGGLPVHDDGMSPDLRFQLVSTSTLVLFELRAQSQADLNAWILTVQVGG